MTRDDACKNGIVNTGTFVEPTKADADGLVVKCLSRFGSMGIKAGERAGRCKTRNVEWNGTAEWNMEWNAKRQKNLKDT